jgi:hypothetical protein
MDGIPFQLPDIGLREIHGTVSLDEEFLVFDVEDALVGEFDKEREIIKIEPAALREIRFDRGIIRDRICIRPKRDDLLVAMPGEYEKELQLKVWRTKRDDAERLVEAVAQRMATGAESPS